MENELHPTSIRYWYWWIRGKLILLPRWLYLTVLWVAFSACFLLIARPLDDLIAANLGHGSSSMATKSILLDDGGMTGIRYKILDLPLDRFVDGKINIKHYLDENKKRYAYIGSSYVGTGGGIGYTAKSVNHYYLDRLYVRKFTEYPHNTTMLHDGRNVATALDVLIIVVNVFDVNTDKTIQEFEIQRWLFGYEQPVVKDMFSWWYNDKAKQTFTKDNQSPFTTIHDKKPEFARPYEKLWEGPVRGWLFAAWQVAVEQYDVNVYGKKKIGPVH